MNSSTSHSRSFASYLAAALCLITFACGLLAATAAGPADANWPQWRGPLENGVAPLAAPPIEWSQEKNIKWKIKIPGEGTSVPIIWDKYVFVQTAIPTGKKVELPPEAKEPAANAPTTPPASATPPAAPNSFQPSAPAADAPGATPPAAPPAGANPPAANANQPGAQGGRGGRGGMRSEPATEILQFVLMCLDRNTGNTLWQQTAREELPHEGHHPDHGFCSYSPVTDGTCIIAYFGSRGLYCYDMQGNLKWSKDLGKMNIKNEFGEGSSPALYGNIVIVNWDHEGEDFIAAFNKETGEELWRTPREEGTTWGTPFVINFDGKPQVVVNATGRCRSYDLATGQQVWEAPGLTTNAIPSPVGADGMVFCMSGFRGSKLLAIKLGNQGDLTGTDAIAWTYDKDTPYVPSPLLYGNRLYITKSNNAILTCLDAKTGTVLYGPERLEGTGNFYASPVAAAGRVYLVGRDGTTLVLKDGDTLEVLATNKLDDPIDASPAIAGKELYLRSKEMLYCISAE